MFHQVTAIAVRAVLLPRSAAIVAFACLLAQAEDWPTYLHDAARGGATSERLAVPLAANWAFVPRHAPQPAWPDPGKEPMKICFDQVFHVAAAKGALYFGSSADGKVYCLDAVTGETRWEVFTDGPVRLAPAVWDGRVYVGSDDGHAYCLSADDGKVRWKRRGGPTDRKTIGNGKMISVWPVRTGVLVRKGVAYFIAGTFPSEGVFVHAVDAATGKTIWENGTTGQLYRKMPHPGAEAFSGVTPQGALLASATRLYVPTGRNVPAAYDLDTGRLVQYEPEARYRVGGTYALAVGDLVFSGPAGLAAYQGDTGDVCARFPGRRLVVTQDIAYLLGSDEIIAVDQGAYTELRTQHTALGEKRTKAHRDRWYWGRRLKSLQEKLKREQTPKLEEIQKRVDGLNRQYKDLTAQMKELDGATSRCVKWKCKCDCPYSLILAGDTLVAGGQDKVMAVSASDGKPVWQAPVKGGAHGLAVAHARLFVSTDSGTIHCFAGRDTLEGEPKQHAQRVSSKPYPHGARQALYANAAEAIVGETGIDRGYCLVLDCGEGRLAYELAKRTKLRIVGIESDPPAVAAARRALDGAGLYGDRVVVHHASGQRLPYSDYFANLIVCDGAIAAGRLHPAPTELIRVLRPYGGAVCVGQPKSAAEAGRALTADELRKWFASASLSPCHVSEDRGIWAKFTRGPLPGAGEWTHQYADAGNTASSGDRVVKGPLGLLWFGDPGPAELVNRHCKAPAPICIEGRLSVSGSDVIHAIDAYNGFPLWERTIQGSRRIGMHGESSNMVASADSLYIGLPGKCLRLDAATGHTLAELTAPGAAGSELRPWGYLAVAGDLLLGSAGLPNTYTYWDEDSIRALIRRGLTWPVIDKMRFLPPAHYKTRKELEAKIRQLLTPAEFEKHKAALLREPGIPAGGLMTDALFALDRRNGDLKWTHRVADGYVHNVAIAVGGGRVYLTETSLAEPNPRRVVALDLLSGNRVWERSIDVTGCGGPGQTLIYAKETVLVAGGSGGKRMVALSAKDGSTAWDLKIHHSRHPVVADGVIYAEPNAHDLLTGQAKMRKHPLTGESVHWQFARAYGCGAVAGCPTALCFRSGTIGLYDLAADEGTSNWGGVRPGCWINAIPAAGLILAPEGSSGCTCSYPLQASMALAPVGRNENWSVFHTAGAALPVKHIAVNLGAPGDRRDAAGTLWLSFPRPPAKYGLRFEMRNELRPGCGYFHHNSDALGIDGAEAPWVFASGARGLTRSTLKLMDRGKTPGVYTVRLSFVELTHERT